MEVWTGTPVSNRNEIKERDKGKEADKEKHLFTGLPVDPVGEKCLFPHPSLNIPGTHTAPPPVSSLASSSNIDLPSGLGRSRLIPSLTDSSQIILSHTSLARSSTLLYFSGLAYQFMILSRCTCPWNYVKLYHNQPLR